MAYEHLEWDSSFLGCKVAKVTDPTLSADDIEHILKELKRDNYALVYWPSDTELDAASVERLSGQLVDKKTVFEQCLENINDSEKSSPYGEIVSFSVGMDAEAVKKLAVESGALSRFAVDVRYPHEKFVELYRIWAEKSLTKELAREVLVAVEDEQIVGMITLDGDIPTGTIGLVAVNAQMRGQKFGFSLVQNALRWFKDNGYRSCKVVTQADNLAACKLYQKCGFEVAQVSFFYHFWL